MANTTNLPGGSSYALNRHDAYSPWHTNTFSLPTARLARNNKRPLIVTQMWAFVSGNGATRTVSMEIGNKSTGNFSVTAASAPASTGWRSITSGNFADTQNVNVELISSGDTRFGLASSAGDWFNSTGYNYGGALCGQFQWVQCPTAPTNVQAAVGDVSTTYTISWTAPSDNGGSSLTGYDVQYSSLADFSGYATATSTGTSVDLTGLDPDTTYYVRVSAKNAVTAIDGTGSQFSTIISFKVGTGGTVTPGNISFAVWSGTEWQEPA